MGKRRIFALIGALALLFTSAVPALAAGNRIGVTITEIGEERFTAEITNGNSFPIYGDWTSTLTDAEGKTVEVQKGRVPSNLSEYVPGGGTHKFTVKWKSPLDPGTYTLHLKVVAHQRGCGNYIETVEVAAQFEVVPADFDHNYGCMPEREGWAYAWLKNTGEVALDVSLVFEEVNIDGVIVPDPIEVTLQPGEETGSEAYVGWHIVTARLTIARNDNGEVLFDEVLSVGPCELPPADFEYDCGCVNGIDGWAYAWLENTGKVALDVSLAFEEVDINGIIIPPPIELVFQPGERVGCEAYVGWHIVTGHITIKRIDNGAVLFDKDMTVGPCKAISTLICKLLTLTPTSGNAPLTVYASIIGIDAVEAEINWDSGWEKAPGFESVHTFQEPGIYNVKARVLGRDGVWYESGPCTGTVRVEKKPSQPWTGLWGYKSVVAPYWFIKSVVDRFADTVIGQHYDLDELRLVDGTLFSEYVPSSENELVEVWGGGFNADLGGYADDVWFVSPTWTSFQDGVWNTGLIFGEDMLGDVFAAAIYRGFDPESPLAVVARELEIEWEVVVKEAPYGIGDHSGVLKACRPLPRDNWCYVGWWFNRWVPQEEKPPVKFNGGSPPDPERARTLGELSSLPKRMGTEVIEALVAKRSGPYHFNKTATETG